MKKPASAWEDTLRVDAVMTKTAATIRSDASIAEAIGKLVEHKISGLPVVNELGRLVGMVTEGDLLRRIELGTQQPAPKWLGFLHGREKAAQAYVHDRTKRVADIMSRDPVSVDEAAPLDEVVALMERRGVRRMPVVAKGGLVGIVSRSDLVRLLGAMMNPGAAPRRPDGVVRNAVMAELQKQPWFKGCAVLVEVQDGIVRFKGVVPDDATETALRVAAEIVPGVVAVKRSITVGHS